MAEDIEKFKYVIDYSFTNKALLREALTHRSYAVENNLNYDNQRLEFLGDAVLELTLTEYLYHLYPATSEGDLTKMRSALVQQEALAQLAKHLKIGRFLLVGHGELDAGGNERESTLSDLFEALLGAFYLDAGFEQVKAFIKTLIKAEFPEPKKLLLGLNPKGLLQEYAQRKWSKTPEYTIIQITGPDHNPKFEVEVKIGKISSRGIAQNRKMSEFKAAQNALIQIAQTDNTLNDLLGLSQK